MKRTVKDMDLFKKTVRKKSRYCLRLIISLCAAVMILTVTGCEIPGPISGEGSGQTQQDGKEAVESEAAGDAALTEPENTPEEPPMEEEDMGGSVADGSDKDGSLAEEAETEDPAAEDNTEESPEPLPEYTELLKINPYVAGWLKVDDSKIDDPVVYTPGSQNFFLHRAIDGSDQSKGTLFIAVDWQPGYNNTLIYGHNMKDGTAFGSLAKFADESYGRKHHTIHFDTLYEEKDYELFAAFYSQIPEEEIETEEDREQADKEIAEEGIEKKAEEGEVVEPQELTLHDINLWYDFGGEDIYRLEKDDDRGRFRYYYFTDLTDRSDFDYYVRNVKDRALYDMGIEADWGDEFITLSTCSYHVKNGRFVVVGIRKKEQ